MIMKTCIACKTRMPDYLIGDDGSCLDKTRCVERQQRAMQDTAALYSGLVSISEALYGWQKRIATNAVEKGFRTFDHPVSRENVAVFASNLHSEVSELWEAFRSGRLMQPCEKAAEMLALGLPVLTCAEEELADIIIRAFDVADAFGIDLMRAMVAKYVFNTTREPRHGGKAA